MIGFFSGIKYPVLGSSCLATSLKVFLLIIYQIAYDICFADYCLLLQPTSRLSTNNCIKDCRNHDCNLLYTLLYYSA
ncbi:hypothetical protein Hanom_Chr08g00704121 [Helianthus anomalus]